MISIFAYLYSIFYFLIMEVGGKGKYTQKNSSNQITGISTYRTNTQVSPQWKTRQGYTGYTWLRLFTELRTHLGEENGNLLQYSYLENPMDGGAWWATVHGIAKSRTRLSNFTHSNIGVWTSDMTPNRKIPNR